MERHGKSKLEQGINLVCSALDQIDIIADKDINSSVAHRPIYRRR